MCVPLMHVCTPDAHEAVFAHDLHESGEPNKDLMQGATQDCTYLTLHQNTLLRKGVQE